MKKFIFWCVGAIASGIIGIVLAVLLGAIDERYADPRNLSCMVREEAPYWFGSASPPSGDHLRVLVFPLAGDDNDRVKAHVVASLRRIEGVEVQPICEPLPASGDTSGNENEGRRWLHARSASALVWGSVDSDYDVHLAWLSAHGSTNLQHYPLDKNFVLSPDFSVPFDLVVAAQLFQYSKGGSPEDQFAREERLHKLLPRMRNALANPSLVGKQDLAALKHAYRDSLLYLSEQDSLFSGGTPSRPDYKIWLQQQIDIDREALTEFSRNEIPDQWGWINLSLGNALAESGKHAEAERYLNEATKDAGLLHSDFGVLEIGNAYEEIDSGNGLMLQKAIGVYRNRAATMPRCAGCLRFPLGLPDVLLKYGLQQHDEAALAEAQRLYLQMASLPLYRSCPDRVLVKFERASLALGVLRDDETLKRESTEDLKKISGRLAHMDQDCRLWVQNDLELAARDSR